MFANSRCLSVAITKRTLTNEAIKLIFQLFCLLSKFLILINSTAMFHTLVNMRAPAKQKKETGSQESPACRYCNTERNSTKTKKSPTTYLILPHDFEHFCKGLPFFPPSIPCSEYVTHPFGDGGRVDGDSPNELFPFPFSNYRSNHRNVQTKIFRRVCIWDCARR